MTHSAPPSNASTGGVSPRIAQPHHDRQRRDEVGRHAGATDRRARDRIRRRRETRRRSGRRRGTTPMPTMSASASASSRASAGANGRQARAPMQHAAQRPPGALDAPRKRRFCATTRRPGSVRRRGTARCRTRSPHRPGRRRSDHRGPAEGHRAADDQRAREALAEQPTGEQRDQHRADARSTSPPCPRRAPARRRSARGCRARTTAARHHDAAERSPGRQLAAAADRRRPRARYRRRAARTSASGPAESCSPAARIPTNADAHRTTETSAAAQREARGAQVFFFVVRTPRGVAAGGSSTFRRSCSRGTGAGAVSSVDARLEISDASLES